MIGNSGAPLEHLVHPAVCSTLGFGAKRLHVVEPTFFRKWGRGGRGPGAGSEPWGPQPAPWPTAAPGGEKREGGALHRPYPYPLPIPIPPSSIIRRRRRRRASSGSGRRSFPPPGTPARPPSGLRPMPGVAWALLFLGGNSTDLIKHVVVGSRLRASAAATPPFVSLPHPLPPSVFVFRSYVSIPASC
jgi:hypothetical protein